MTMTPPPPPNDQRLNNMNRSCRQREISNASDNVHVDGEHPNDWTWMTVAGLYHNRNNASDATRDPFILSHNDIPSDASQLYDDRLQMSQDHSWNYVSINNNRSRHDYSDFQSFLLHAIDDALLIASDNMYEDDGGDIEDGFNDEKQ
jgi:hypothetical protein